MHCKNNNLGLNANSCNDGLRHIEQIALNKAGIDCLGGRMCRAEADIKDRYTKAELDQILVRKMDKCGYHRPSCNGKPNICDFYTKEELDQLLAEIACKCDTYSKEELDELLEKIACTCDCYSKVQTDELLLAKANAGTPQHFDLVGGDFEVGGVYWKTDDNQVGVHISVGTVDGSVISKKTIGVLPKGFRPKFYNQFFPITLWSTSDGVAIGFVSVNPEDGRIIVSDLIPPMETYGSLNIARGVIMFLSA